MNAVSMNDAQQAARDGLSILSLRFEVVDDRPDWPVVSILVDGQDPFAEVAPEWRGFDPAKILGPSSVSWVDFRDYTGVFAGPVTESLAGGDGSSPGRPAGAGRRGCCTSAWNH